MPPLISRNEISPAGANNIAMRFGPPSEQQMKSPGPKRPGLGIMLSLFIVLAGVIGVVALLIAYGLMGTF